MDSTLMDENSARQYLDSRLQENDVKGAMEFAIKGQNRFPKLKRLLRFLSNIVVQVSTVDEEIDWYSVLGVDPSADIKTMKQQYVKLAKNNKLGSQEAHKLLNKAWDTLSNKFTRRDYDTRRISRQMQQDAFVVKHASSSAELLQPAPASGNKTSGPGLVSSATQAVQMAPGLYNISENDGKHLTSISAATNSTQPTPDVYSVSGNKERGPGLVSTDTPLIQPALGMHSVSGKNRSGPGLVSTDTPLIQPALGMQSVSGNNGSGPSSVSPSSKSFHIAPGLCSGSQNNGSSLTKLSSDAQLFESAHVNLKRRYEGEDSVKVPCTDSKESGICLPPVAGPIGGTNIKHRKRLCLVKDTLDSCKNASADNRPTGSNGQKSVPKVSQEEGIQGDKREAEKVGGSGSRKGKSKKNSLHPYEVKNMLMEMARSVIICKLNERNAAARDNNEHKPADNKDVATIEGPKEEQLKTMEVPDSEFHDFDSDRTKESFAENQVWAVYDEDDGMPRLYALIRKVSKRSSKLQLSWLNAECNMEPESLKWIDSGFHKTCGDFCIQNEIISIELNSFSHRVAGCTKAANVVQIFPKKGDVWALYRNWSPEWNKHTSEEEKHKYEIVEVVADYDEDKGVTIVPLVKVAGFKAVFCQHSDAREVRMVPKKEIFRFSHQVSSYPLAEQEAPNVPKSSKELDPAALPLELLQVMH